MYSLLTVIFVHAIYVQTKLILAFMFQIWICVLQNYKCVPENKLRLRIESCI